MKNVVNYKISFVLLFSGIALLLAVGSTLGSFHTSWTEVYSAITAYDSTDMAHYAVVEMRIPRLIAALLVGALLGISGYLMQAMVNNPLADPYLLGTSSGAGVGVSLVYAGIVSTGIYTVSIVSFLGACIVTLLALALAYERGNINPVKLLLAGLALSSLMVAGTSLLSHIATDGTKLKNIIYWSMGTFEGIGWDSVYILAIVLLVTLVVFIFYQSTLSILLLGQERATNLGVNTRNIRLLILLFTALSVGVAVAAAGPIGFVGLIIPHVVRRLYGVHGKFNILLVAIWGGFFLLMCEVAIRFFFPDKGMPVGIVTSFVGIPFFIVLLWKNRVRF